MKVVGPNGLTIDIPASVATGLVGNGKRGYRFAQETGSPAPEVKPRTRRPRKPKADA